ncbi:MAG: two-component system response regulator [Chloroflexi bacterium RBG_16_48_8]|nr:MAG: two-component system response regulator [Chloroflexi bacterium RBG_16_48_8]
MLKRSVTVLYIEDNVDNRLLVKRILEAAGYVVLEAGGASEGLKLIYEQKPDLILLDINLPEVDGITFTKFLRNDPKYERMPILAITADLFRGNEERTLSAGCNGYIQKPIDVDLLPLFIERFIDCEGGLG